MTPKAVHIVGGGTYSHVRSHLSLAAPAFGGTARRLAELCRAQDPESKMDIELHLTKMADPASAIVTNDDLETLARHIASDQRTKIVFWNPAVVDFSGEVEDDSQARLATRNADGSPRSYGLRLTPAKKLVGLFRKERKDFTLVAFKTTVGADPLDQYFAGLNLLKESSANLVLANDMETRVNMVITPEEARYHETTDREEALRQLVDIAYRRSHLMFTRSTVVAGEPVPWDSELVPAALRTVVNHCIERGAYKKFRGATAGHFAVKLGPRTFLTSRRKTDFNDMGNVGLVKVETDGDDAVIAYGAKPSVGGQSQRKVFAANPGLDCIVHFHCPKRPGSNVRTVSQREFECGSHECGENTARGLEDYGALKAVYLDNHGPNLVFSSTVNPQVVIDFIEKNFDLEKKSGGYQLAA